MDLGQLLDDFQHRHGHGVQRGGASKANRHQATALIANWNVRNQAIVDYNLLNTQRLKAFHNLDVRVDKKFYWKWLTLDLYVDVQNVYNFKSELQPIITVERGTDGKPLVDPADPSRYLVKTIPNFAGSVVPTLGLVIEF